VDLFNITLALPKYNCLRSWGANNITFSHTAKNITFLFLYFVDKEKPTIFRLKAKYSGLHFSLFAFQNKSFKN
jgi:hypothetical protein